MSKTPDGLVMVGPFQVPYAHVQICIHLLPDTLILLDHNSVPGHETLGHLVVVVDLWDLDDGLEDVLVDLTQFLAHYLWTLGQLLVHIKEKPPDSFMVLNQKIKLGLECQIKYLV